MKNNKKQLISIGYEVGDIKKILKYWSITFINYMSIGFDSRIGYIFE